MEKLLDEGHLLAGLVIVLCLHLIAKLAHFVWELNNSKHEVTEESIKNLTSVISSNTAAVHELEVRMRAAETQLSEFNKFKVDLRLLILAIKEVAGDRWSDIRKMISDDEFTR